MALHKWVTFAPNKETDAEKWQDAKIGELEAQGLTEYSLAGIENIGIYPFNNLSDYDSTKQYIAEIPSNVNIWKYAFSNKDNIIIVSFPDGQSTIPDYCFYNCKSLKYMTIPSDIGTIGNSAFFSCENLILEEIPFGVTRIKTYAFYDCYALDLKELPFSIVHIEDSAFCFCKNLALTKLPPYVKDIGANAFYGCDKLKVITEIPAYVESIGSQAFGCVEFTTITFKGTPTTIADDAFFQWNFFDSHTITTINVPWAEGAVANAPWGAVNATINYNYKG